VGESIAETLMEEFGAQGEIVLNRAARTEGMRRLSLRPDGGFTKATLIKLGQTLDSDTICYGTYDVSLPTANAPLKESSIHISARFLDLKKLREASELSETGKLTDLSRLEEHIAWQSLRYLQPSRDFRVEEFLGPQKLTRVDAKESYIRGLLSSDKDQQQKWFAQASTLDPKFTSPEFELGNLALNKKDYKQAINWYRQIPPADPRYLESRFKMGLSAYGVNDYTESTNYFREVLKAVPLNEVYNNLGAAENQLSLPVAIDDFRRALDGDQNDPVYLFNLGTALLRNNYFDEAEKRLRAVLDHDPNDREAQMLLARAQRKESSAAGARPLAPERLKENFDVTAFRQLKAVLQLKAK
jgi:tetratricopeptide (TPR) repeat protein